MTDNENTALAARPVHHPDWCRRNPEFCDAWIDGIGLVGNHFAPPQRVKTHYGPELWVGLVSNADDENDARIALRVPDLCDDDDHPATCVDHYTFAGTAQLEPEEALMLARRLTEAVDEWHASRRDHPRTR